MNRDQRDLLSAFHAHGVKYLIVGDYAVIFHSQPRFTKDIDLFIKADSENANATYAALASFGAPLDGVAPEDFADRASFFRFGRDPNGFDILPDLLGVDFDAAWERRIEAVTDVATGLKAFFISKEDLISAKLASGRLRDLADVEELRAASTNAPGGPTETKGGDCGSGTARSAGLRSLAPLPVADASTQSLEHKPYASNYRVNV
jgi:hypothetical protein